MAEAIAVSGFNIPPAPSGASVSQRNDVRPAANDMQPGFVPQPAAAQEPQSGFTQAHIDAAVAAALAKVGKPAEPAPAAVLKSPTASITAGTAEYTPDGTGDKVLNSFTDVFIRLGTGIDIDRALGRAMTSGNVADIDNAYLSEKGGANAEQLKVIANAIVERISTQSADAERSIHASAGGKEQWDAAAAAFNQNAPAHLKQVIARMLNSGDTEAVQSAAKSIVDYSRGNTLVPTNAQLLQGGAGVGSNAGLNKADFQKAHAALDTNSRTYQQERQDLFARRSIGKQTGL